MKNFRYLILTIFIFFAGLSYAQDKENKQDKTETKKKTLTEAKPTGAMKACDQRVNRAAVTKALSQVSLKNFESEFTLKSKLYYPADVEDEIFDVKVVAGRQEFDVAVTMDEKCKKVLKTEVDKLE